MSALDTRDLSAATSSEAPEGEDSPGPGDVYLYMVDTGIEFSALNSTAAATKGFSSISQEPSSRDCNGHGTFTASVAERYLSSPGQQHIIPVKVVGCSGGGEAEDVVRGLDWIAQSHPQGKPAVVNISLAGLGDSSIRKAINKLSSAGIFVVIAAGNYEDDVCGGEYAMQEVHAVTVGALDSSGKLAPSSGFGDCVTTYALGVDVMGAWVGGDVETQTLSGTSVAAPRVAGKLVEHLTQHPQALTGSSDLGRLVRDTCGNEMISIHGIESLVC